MMAAHWLQPLGHQYLTFPQVSAVGKLSVRARLLLYNDSMKNKSRPLYLGQRQVRLTIIPYNYDVKNILPMFVCILKAKVNFVLHKFLQ